MFLEVISSREPLMISEEESGVVHLCSGRTMQDKMNKKRTGKRLKYQEKRPMQQS